MTGSWRLTSYEFSVLLAELGCGDVPVPLTWRATATTHEELRADRVRASRRVADENLRNTADLLVHSDVRIIACGAVSTERSVRIHAGVRRDRGAVVSQRPESAPSRGGDVVVSAVAASDLAAAVFAALPSERPGRVAPGTARRSALLAPPTGVLENSAHENPERALASLMSAPLADCGEIRVGRSERNDMMIDHPDVTAAWFDVLGDGRYLMTGTDIVTVAPGTEARMVEILDPGVAPRHPRRPG